MAVLTRDLEAYKGIGGAKKLSRSTILGTPFKPKAMNEEEEVDKENTLPITAAKKLGKPSRFANLGTPFARNSSDKKEEDIDIKEGAGGISFLL